MSATSGTKAQNVYKDGRLTQTGTVGAANKVPGWMKSHVPGSDIKTRTFVAGEKFFVTSLAVTSDGVVMELLSDPFSDVRYYTNLKFPFKAPIPSVDQVDSTVAEVVKVQADEADAKDSKQAPPATQAAAVAPPAPMAPIPPPPPPTDAPAAPTKTIKLKQTREQVVAAFGEPTSIRDLGLKKVYIYPDMKVTFVNNKVTDIQ